MAERVDLNELERLAKEADQAAYTAKDVTDVFAGGPWDDDTDAPKRLWWIDRPGWVDDADGESLFYTEADARFAMAANPATVLAMVAELQELRGRYGKDDEVWCGARRDQAGSVYCVEMAGHDQHGYPHMWSTRAAIGARRAGDGNG